MSKTPQNKARKPIDKADRPEQDKMQKPERLRQPEDPKPGDYFDSIPGERRGTTSSK